jgi:hypothetical protein
MADKSAVEKAMEEMKKKAHETAGQVTGACVYNAGGKTYCAVLSQSQCSQLRGAFFPGQPCSR